MNEVKEYLEQKIFEFNQQFPNLQVNIKPGNILEIMNNLKEYLLKNETKIEELNNSSVKKDFVEKLQVIYLLTYDYFLSSYPNKNVILIAESKNVLIARERIGREYLGELGDLLYKVIGYKMCEISLIRRMSNKIVDDYNDSMGRLRIGIKIIIAILLLSFLLFILKLLF